MSPEVAYACLHRSNLQHTKITRIPATPKRKHVFNKGILYIKRGGRFFPTTTRLGIPSPSVVKNRASTFTIFSKYHTGQ